jgi:RNA polymerase sigma-70 factor, ECF subfamily
MAAGLEQSEQILAALANVQVEYREAIVLRFHEDLSLEEIAAVTHAPLGTVKSRIYRGLNALMPRLKGVLG